MTGRRGHTPTDDDEPSLVPRVVFDLGGKDLEAVNLGRE